MKRALLLSMMMVVLAGCQSPGYYWGKHKVHEPDQIAWRAGPPSLPPGADYAVLEGDPTKEGFVALRVSMPAGFRIPPHWHGNVERVTVISGALWVGEGDKFDYAALEEIPRGSFSVMKPGKAHYVMAKVPTVIQLTTIGPTSIKYVNPKDDPRGK